MKSIIELEEQIKQLTAERDELKAQWDYYQEFCKAHTANGITDLVVQRDDWKKECDIQRNLRIGVEAVFDTLNEDIGRLKAERDAALEQVKHWRSVTQDVDAWSRADKRLDSAKISVLKSALREAKEALIPYMKFVDGTDVKNHPAQVYDRINKVLGEE